MAFVPCVSVELSVNLVVVDDGVLVCSKRWLVGGCRPEELISFSLWLCDRAADVVVDDDLQTHRPDEHQDRFHRASDRMRKSAKGQYDGSVEASRFADDAVDVTGRFDVLPRSLTPGRGR